MNPGTRDIVRESKGRLVNLRPSKGLARRHVVSSDDVSKHYSKALNGKKWSEGKLLLEQRGSISEARIPVQQPLTLANIEKAAVERYSKFFGYAKNIFIGDSKENSSIQQHLDDGHPEMADAALENHVGRIKRSWALDDKLEVTPVKKE